MQDLSFAEDSAQGASQGPNIGQIPEETANADRISTVSRPQTPCATAVFAQYLRFSFDFPQKLALHRLRVAKVQAFATLG
jgi:hypothetical protein